VEESLLDTALELTVRSQELWSAGDTEKAIDALDEAYSLILKAPADAEGKSIQQKDDLRFMVSKRLMEIYTSRLTTVNGTHKEIPLVVNRHVENEIKLFQSLERDFFLESYHRSGRYHDDMVKAFREAGLPEEIAWLPLIESGFKVRALSRARALGLWQFIPSTGYKFGLKRNAWIDERLDPEKSTAAAIAYLKELHQLFGDWATVLAAYNCGEGNVLRVIRQQKVNYLDNFWDLYERLPRETARYYPRFLAVLTILKDPAKYGFTLEERDKPFSYEVVTVERPLQLGKIAEKIGCSDDDLMALNPELRHAATPDTAYGLKVPFGMKDALLASLDTLPKWSPPRPSYVYHRVRRGETLSTIAVRYRSSVQRIREANNLRNGQMIRAGQKLKIPVRDASG
jgi:membrane-bound lytic murein transglycosylase D